MPKKRLGAQQIVTKLRQVEVPQSQGKSISAACKEVGLPEQSYYRYRKEYGGTHDQELMIKMFHNGDAGSNNAVDARETLGPDWQAEVKRGKFGTC